MAFRIHEITIHLMAGAPGPCMPASPDQGKPDCPHPSCRPTRNKPDDEKPKPGPRRNLTLLQAQLREALAPLPL